MRQARNKFSVTRATSMGLRRANCDFLLASEVPPKPPNNGSIRRFILRTLKLLISITAILIPAVTDGATLNLDGIGRVYYTCLGDPGSSKSVRSASTGSFSGSIQSSDTNANMFAEQDSSMSLSGNILSISGNGDRNSTCSIDNGYEYMYAESWLSVFFTIDSPFSYSILTSLTQTDDPPLSTSEAGTDSIMSYVSLGRSEEHTS